jgi:hypothetical protein
MKVTASQTRELKKVLKSLSDNRKLNGLRHSQESVLWPLLFVPSSVVVAALLLLVSGPVAR